MELTARDNGQSREVRQGEAIVLRLDENPSTGYAWEIAASDGLTLHADRYHPREGMGASGTREYHFKVERQGVCRLRLRLRRSWDREAKGAKEYVITLHSS